MSSSSSASAATIFERPSSRAFKTSRSEQSETLEYVVLGPTNEDDVEAAVSSYAAMTYRNLMRGGIDVKPAAGRLDAWFATVEYQNPEAKESQDPKQVGEITVSFTTLGGRQKITNSMETQAFYNEGPAPDTKGAINIVGDRVEGVEVVVPQLELQIKLTVDEGTITPAYAFTIYELTGKVNNGAFGPFAEGEVLFLGATASEKSSGPVEVTFHFSCSKGVTDGNVAGISGINKEGHQYQWFLYAPVDDSGAKTRIMKAKYCYVETVYEKADFSVLGIPL